MNRLGPKMPPALPEAYATVVATILRIANRTTVFQHYVAVENLADVAITHAHYVWEKITEQSHGKAARHRLEPDAPFGKAFEPTAQSKQQFDENYRSEPSYYSQCGVDGKFGGMNQTVGRDMKQGIVTQH